MSKMLIPGHSITLLDSIGHGECTVDFELLVNANKYSVLNSCLLPCVNRRVWNCVHHVHVCVACVCMSELSDGTCVCVCVCVYEHTGIKKQENCVVICCGDGGRR